MTTPVETYHENGEWRNRHQGSDYILSAHDVKASAETYGRRVALRDGVEHIVRRADGVIERRHDYGRTTNAAGK